MEARGKARVKHFHGVRVRLKGEREGDNSSARRWEAGTIRVGTLGTVKEGLVQRSFLRWVEWDGIRPKGPRLFFDLTGDPNETSLPVWLEEVVTPPLPKVKVGEVLCMTRINRNPYVFQKAVVTKVGLKYFRVDVDPQHSFIKEPTADGWYCSRDTCFAVCREEKALPCVLPSFFVNALKELSVEVNCNNHGVGLLGVISQDKANEIRAEVYRLLTGKELKLPATLDEYLEEVEKRKAKWHQ